MKAIIWAAVVLAASPVLAQCRPGECPTSSTYREIEREAMAPPPVDINAIFAPNGTDEGLYVRSPWGGVWTISSQPLAPVRPVVLPCQPVRRSLWWLFGPRYPFPADVRQ